MIEGMLVINLNPSYIGFSSTRNQSDKPFHVWRNCSADDIRYLLIELKAMGPHEKRLPHDCVLRMFTALPDSTLEKLGLAAPSAQSQVKFKPARSRMSIS